MASEFNGRIIIYSVVGCPFCMRAKATLEGLGLPFTDVRLDSFNASVREEVKERTGKRTVPQIFFNEIHVGGNEDLQKLVNEDKEEFEKLINLVRTTEPPEGAPKVPDESLRLAEEADVDFTCEADEYAKLVKDLKDSGIITNHRNFLTIYKNTFTGKSYVDWFTASKDLDRDVGIQSGQMLLERKFLHVVKGKENEFENSESLYRLYEQEDSSALNAKMTSECEPRPASDLGESLRKLILSIYNEHLSPDGKGVDYKGIASSEKFKKYIKATGELVRVNLEEATSEDKLAFFINIYNALVIHATVVSGYPTNLWSKYKFFNYSSYIIGGHRYSLQDIENGVLRSNRRGVGALSRQFGKSDPRLKVMLEKAEPLIHFALVCGAKSCPPIKTYSSEGVYEQLKLASESFLESDDGCRVDSQKGIIYLSKIFSWYKEDFGGTDTSVAKWVSEHLAESEKKTQMDGLMKSGSFKVVYMPYDWSSNAKH